jgi:CRP-like cAMP-binding protein
MLWEMKQRQKHDGNVIKSIPFFSELSTDELEDIERLIVKKKFSKDQIVLYEEDTANYMYIVYSGKTRVVKLHDDGREQIITIHKKCDFFGEMALLDGMTSPATVIAHEDAVIGLFSKEDFQRLILTHQDISKKIINLLAERLRDAWAMIKVLSFEDAEHRVMAVLDRLQELYGVTDDRGVIINVKLTHQQLASYASIARETLTRILNRLEKESVICVLENKSILLHKSFNLKFKAVR